jgi:hypothetical protein
MRRKWLLLWKQRSPFGGILYQILKKYYDETAEGHATMNIQNSIFMNVIKGAYRECQFDRINVNQDIHIPTYIHNGPVLKGSDDSPLLHLDFGLCALSNILK